MKELAGQHESSSRDIMFSTKRKRTEVIGGEIKMVMSKNNSAFEELYLGPFCDENPLG